MTIQRIVHHFLQRLVDRLVVHLTERFLHVHLFSMTLFNAAVKLVSLSHHIDNHIEGDFIAYITYHPNYYEKIQQNGSQSCEQLEISEKVKNGSI